MSFEEQSIEYRPITQYKYQLTESYTYTVPDGHLLSSVSYTGANGWVNFRNTNDSETRVWGHRKKFTRFVCIRKGYCWDGPSGPTVDTENFMRGSLIHDALYQLMREYPDLRTYRNGADRLLQRICIEDGMSRMRAALVYWGVKTWGKRAAGGE